MPTSLFAAFPFIFRAFWAVWFVKGLKVAEAYFVSQITTQKLVRRSRIWRSG